MSFIYTSGMAWSSAAPSEEPTDESIFGSDEEGEDDEIFGTKARNADEDESADTEDVSEDTDDFWQKMTGKNLTELNDAWLAARRETTIPLPPP